MGRIIFVEAGDSAYTPLMERVHPKATTIPTNVSLLLGGILVVGGILRFYYDRLK